MAGVTPNFEIAGLLVDGGFGNVTDVAAPGCSLRGVHVGSASLVRAMCVTHE